MRYKSGTVSVRSSRSVEDHLELAFEHLPSAFAKLSFLTTVRDPYTGRYLHEGWTLADSPEEIHKLLRSTHNELFEFVCGLSIGQLCSQLDGYLRTLPVPCERAISLWNELESYREMIPEGTCVAERDFFASQMQIALDVLANAPEWVRRDQSSWRFQPPLQQFPRHLEN